MHFILLLPECVAHFEYFEFLEFWTTLHESNSLLESHHSYMFCIGCEVCAVPNLIFHLNHTFLVIVPNCLSHFHFDDAHYQWNE